MGRPDLKRQYQALDGAVELGIDRIYMRIWKSRMQRPTKNQRQSNAIAKPQLGIEKGSATFQLQSLLTRVLPNAGERI